ncbi:hypothetical protein BDK51DRAFT_50461 [Blyttiomyces helicus]|uniref:IPT/TIG domain-containing protein n=1 Tax=Blyttiomyces helicus TaxID=388810 RepID=A0A4P9W4R3_9FUNG|nr:hypothetical protein BDK51DRAFT_50461 [Blyttiomyces helicus]|eukprot:RKO85858.1 hypothetical protein BDK51DRAFT_50461 [Blyttiomyces helicus]
MSSWAKVTCMLGRVDFIALSGANLSCPNGLLGSAAWYAGYWDFSDNSIGVVPDGWFSGANRSSSVGVEFKNTGFVSNLSWIFEDQHFEQQYYSVIPSSLAGATYLMELNLEINSFYGTIPVELSAFQDDAILLAGNQVHLVPALVRVRPPFLIEAFHFMTSTSAKIVGPISIHTTSNLLLPIPIPEPTTHLTEIADSLRPASPAPIDSLDLMPHNKHNERVATACPTGSGASITVLGEGFLDVDGFQCLFGTTAVPAAVQNSTVMTCAMPLVIPGNLSLYVAFKGQQISLHSVGLTALTVCSAGYYRKLEVADCEICPGNLGGGGEGAGEACSEVHRCLHDRHPSSTAAQQSAQYAKAGPRYRIHSADGTGQSARLRVGPAVRQKGCLPPRPSLIHTTIRTHLAIMKPTQE